MALPGLSSAGVGLGVAVALVDTTGLLADGSETAGFAVLCRELVYLSKSFVFLVKIIPCEQG